MEFLTSLGQDVEDQRETGEQEAMARFPVVA